MFPVCEFKFNLRFCVHLFFSVFWKVNVQSALHFHLAKFPFQYLKPKETKLKKRKQKGAGVTKFLKSKEMKREQDMKVCVFLCVLSMFFLSNIRYSVISNLDIQEFSCCSCFCHDECTPLLLFCHDVCVGDLPIAKYLKLQAFLQDQDREKKVKKRDRILPVSEGGDVLDRFKRK